MEYQLRCTDGVLIVSTEVRDRGDLHTAIVSLLMAVFKIRTWSDSRWLASGSSARAMVASHLVGLSAFWFWVSRKHTAKGCYLNGFFRLKERQWRFLVHNAVVALIPEAALAELLKDGRVALTAPTIKARMRAAMLRVSELAQSVWTTLATVCTMDWMELRGNCIRAAHRSIAFFTFRVFDVAEQLPFTLCRGDVEQNLRDLHADPRPRNNAAAKLWDLMARGDPMPVLERLVRLIGDVVWVTVVIEQLHAHCALMSRFHPEYGLAMLLARGMLCTMCKLLPSLTKTEKEVAKLTKAKDRLDRKRPRRAGPRQRFFADLANRAMDTRVTPETTTLDKRDLAKVLMKSFDKRWRDKSHTTKFAYKVIARVQASRKENEIREARDGVIEKLIEAREKVEEEAQERTALSLRGASWGDAELKDFSSLQAGDEYGLVKVGELRDASCTAPPRMTEGLMEILEEQDIGEEPRKLQPEWLGAVSHLRDHFDGVVFVINRGDAKAICQFVFAIQQPEDVYIAWLREDESFLPVIDNPAAFTVAQRTWKRHTFVVDFMDNQSVSCLHDVPRTDIMVIEDVTSLGGNKLGSNAQEVSLKSFIDHLPEPTRRAPTTAGDAKQPVKKKVHLEMDFPWAEKGLQKLKRHREKTTPKTPVLLPTVQEQCDEETDDDEQNEDRDGEIDALRREWEMNPGCHCMDFDVKFLEGESTFKKKGVWEDGVQGYASGNKVKNWCRKHHLQITVRYEIDLYGLEIANTLARTWMLKMQHFYDIATDHVDGIYKWTDKERETWHEPLDFTQLQPVAARDKDTRKRMAPIVELFA